jgi:hypothetical protein
MTPEPPAAPPKPILSSWQNVENWVGNVPLIIVNGLFTVNAQASSQTPDGVIVLTKMRPALGRCDTYPPFLRLTHRLWVQGPVGPRKFRFGIAANHYLGFGALRDRNMSARRV